MTATESTTNVANALAAARQQRAKDLGESLATYRKILVSLCEGKTLAAKDAAALGEAMAELRINESDVQKDIAALRQDVHVKANCEAGLKRAEGAETRAAESTTKANAARAEMQRCEREAAVARMACESAGTWTRGLDEFRAEHPRCFGSVEALQRDVGGRGPMGWTPVSGV